MARETYIRLRYRGNNLTRDQLILNEELAALEANKTLPVEQKSEMTYRLLKEFGEKYRKKE